SIYRQLLQRPGYTPVEYEGDRAEFAVSDGTLRLWGDAVVTRQGEKLQADSIFYRDATKITTAYGNPRVTGSSQNIEGDVLVYDMGRRQARVIGGRTEFAQSGATWYVRGDTVAAEQETNRVYAVRSTFTTDEREEPQYHFEAGKILVIKDRVLVGRPAVLYFRNVPVAWLPFIVQDMEQGRRSGILTPRFGINDIVRTNSGYQREISNVGYYWAINEYMGAQLASGWRSNSFTSLAGAFEFNVRRRFLRGNASMTQYFRDEGGREQTLGGNTSWKPDERTDLSMQGSYASSSRFVRERSTDPFEATQTLQSTLSLRRRFDWGDASFGSERRQTLGNGKVEWTFPNVAITPQTLTLFPATSPETSRWFSNLSITASASGARTGVDVPLDTTRTPQGALIVGSRSLRSGNATVSNSITMGDLGLSNSLSINRRDPLEIVGVDREGLALDEDAATLSSSLSYRIGLMGTTYIAPGVSMTREFRRDSTTRLLSGDGFLSAPPRISVGADLFTDLFGFFPGVAGVERIRHHIRPGIRYSYAPAVKPDSLQRRVFGTAVGETLNRISLTFDQTFEGKLRTPTPAVLPTLADTAGLDSVPADSAALARSAPPADARKLTLLALSTSGFDYDLERARTRGWRAGLLTDQVTGSLRSDFLRGLNVQFGLDLFRDVAARPPGTDPSTRDPSARDPFARGGFAPILTSMSTSFSLGGESAIFRWLATVLSGERESMTPARTLVPDSANAPVDAPFGGSTASNNRQGPVGGPWSASLTYSLNRVRGGLPSLNGGFTEGQSQQMLNGNLSFSPTPNWQVNWQTSLDVTNQKFGAHSLRLVRDLYRWQANFGFYRTPVGNTSFDFTVHLKDLPDLKLDYRERNIGVDRRER
ncbi:MAG: hypothetical protein M3483_05020, partial [Gemmatimonadota bacterium]|nr:hypothetical protein [Gemmatimonadota bacterium]